MLAPTVFVSYSHTDKEWTNKLLPHLHALEQAGVEMNVWHDRKIDGGDRWYPEIQDAMANAAAAILMISADFLGSRFCVQEEVPFLLKRQEKQGMLLIPVLLRTCQWKAHRWLADRQMIPRDGKSVAIDFAGDLADSVFAAVAEQVLTHFQQLAAEPREVFVVPAQIQHLDAPRIVAPDSSIIPPPPAVLWPALSAERIDLTRLPETGSALFGRDEELRLLDEAWASPQQATANPLRILAFTAYGGFGKSTLVNHWLADMARDHYRGATHVFGWSFYSQGVQEQNTASADSFIDAALRFFGDADPTVRSPWDKGERLAHLVGGQRALLVLDGLEPLQSAYGKLCDPALESLLRGLARDSGGLCLITTREPVIDLAGRPGVTMRDLEQITARAGRALLRTARVVGKDAELEALANRFGPHALAVSLLGVYLYEQPGHGIGPAQALEQLPRRAPVDRVLAGFEQWLGDSPEREALQLLGFFDRPADAGCLRALRSAPAIPGLTDRLAGLGDAEWGSVLARLEKLRLIHLIHGESAQQSMDAHPLLREYFAGQLRMRHPEAWRAAHRRLYEHLCATTQDKPQPTLEELQPLYQAVAHGCQAGMQQEARDKVYGARILRGDEFYSLTTLGAFGIELGAVACFFETPWSRPSPSLTEDAQAWLLNEAAITLRGLGWLTEAIEPMRVATTWAANKEDWKHAAIGAKNLSELELTLGEVAGAVRDAEQSVAYADRSGMALERILAVTTYADALHQAGHRPEAKARFREAEEMQTQFEPEYPLLYSRKGFWHCDLLLADPERAAWQLTLPSFFIPNPSDLPASCVSNLPASCRAVEQLAAQKLQGANSQSLVATLDVALDRLTLGRASLYAAILEKAEVGSTKSEVDQVVEGLYRAGDQPFIPLGLLTRAWARFLEGNAAGAQADLDEAWEIAERGPMRLHMADIHLYRARLFHAVTPYPWEGSPRADLAAARQLIERCGYWRRKEELDDAEAAAEKW